MTTPLTLLSGDLGGTKTLLAIFQLNNGLKKLYQKRYKSSEWDSLEPMLKNFLSNLPKGIPHPKKGCLAVAGPVLNGSAQITNLNWPIKETEICAYAGLDQVELINDFSVLLYGLPFLNNQQHVEIQAPRSKLTNKGIVAILGAGTGLGIARGLKTSTEIQVLPSEGGHAEFSPRSEIEWDLAQWLKNDLGLNRLSLERIVSGTGLGHIAHWRLAKSDTTDHPLNKLAIKWRTDPQKQLDLPALVSKAAMQGDLLMKQVLDIWLSAYGSAAGDLALQELPNAGLWIAGGTARKHLQGLQSKTFLDAMHNKGRFRSFLQDLPVMALTDPEVGLFSVLQSEQSLLTNL